MLLSSLILVAIVFALFSTLSVNGSDNNLRNADTSDINIAYSLPNEIDREELLVHGNEDRLMHDRSENNLLRVDTSEINKVYPLSDEIYQADSLVRSDEDWAIQDRELGKICGRGNRNCKCKKKFRAICIGRNTNKEHCKCKRKLKTKPCVCRPDCPKGYDPVCIIPGLCRCRG